jgi:hypothetical protein
LQDAIQCLFGRDSPVSFDLQLSFCCGGPFPLGRDGELAGHDGMLVLTLPLSDGL